MQRTSPAPESPSASSAVPQTATAAVFHEPGGEATLETIELDALRNNEVLVRVEACGICYTDIKFQHMLPLPGVFGHEGTGVVEAVGSGVTVTRPGDRVILSYPWCGTCPYCEDHEPYRCENIPALKFGGKRTDGTSPIRLDGQEITGAFFQQSSFATRAVVLDQVVVPVQTEQPSHMLAALPCGVQTGAGAILNTFQVAQGQSLIVFGAGAVGLSAVMAARLVGASPIILVDRVESRLALGQELGATHVFNFEKTDVPAAVRKVSHRGMRYAFESSATVPALKHAIECLGQGGKVGIVSAPPPHESFEFNTRPLFVRVASMHSIVQGFSVPREFLPKLIGYQEEGRFPYEKLITTYPFEHFNQALADAKSGAVVKPVLMMPPP